MLICSYAASFIMYIVLVYCKICKILLASIISRLVKNIPGNLKTEIFIASRLE